MARWYEGGAFISANGLPTQDRPEDWYAWHFTHKDNLGSIARDSALYCAESNQTYTDIGNPGIKLARQHRIVAADNYPSDRAVSDHVPFYIAAKSPMLYTLRSRADDLVLLGVTIRSLINAGLDFVISDGNARSNITGFVTDLQGLGDFVDFRVLQQKYWSNTPQDPDRKRRRQAEVLVFESVPLSLVSVVIAKVESTRSVADEALSGSLAPDARIVTVPSFFYPGD